jgi:hypothetical protein
MFEAVGNLVTRSDSRQTTRERLNTEDRYRTSDYDTIVASRQQIREYMAAREAATDTNSEWEMGGLHDPTILSGVSSVGGQVRDMNNHQ